MRNLISNLAEFRNRLVARIDAWLETLPPARRRAAVAGMAAAGLLFLVGLGGAGYLWSLARQFPQAPFEQPSRLYGRADRLAPGQAFRPSELIDQLAFLGYREAPAGQRLTPGTFLHVGDTVAVHLRRFPTPEGPEGGAPVEVRFQGGRIARLRVAGRAAESAVLEPPLLASYYSPEMEERRPVTLDELPEHVVQAVLAAEDDAFFVHPGVSVPGILRALWVNLRGGEMQQGGSTITQQLVKNVYLSNRRTLTRKAKEAVIALALETRYGKRAILEAYLNEIYLGRSGSVNVIGLGAAARAYFGKEASALSLEEAALLAGMIQAPSSNLPTEHPRAAVERRDWVLKRLGELGWVDEPRVRRATQEPLRLAPQTVKVRPLAPYFAEMAASEARDRFGIDDLNEEGYLLFSTLSWRDQRAAEAAMAEELGALDKREKRRKEPLQAALVSVDPESGAILAYVGGRDYDVSQFDRVTQAKRQAGSTFKPVIYAAAFTEGVITPASLLKDSPIAVRVDNESWRPQNYDRTFRGMVTARTALARSLNIPTVRVALQVGLPRVIDLARDLGIQGELEPVPALALGAFEVSPREMAQVYSTLASGGLRPTLHGLAAVLDPSGEPVQGEELPSPERVLQPHAAYLVTSVLEGVVDPGAANAQTAGSLAGKTGTTNDRRDSWFAGYSPDRVTVVWVGYDDNSRTRLSGATAALPLWRRFVRDVRPAGGFPAFVPPAGTVTVTVDPATGQLATPYCPYSVAEVFPEWQAPSEPCQRHTPGYTTVWAEAGYSYSDPAFDPVTGEPVEVHWTDPYGEEEARIAITNAAPVPAALEPLPLEATAAPMAPVTIVPVRRPLRPVPMPAPMPTDIEVAAVEPPADPAQEGTIVIRPSRERTEAEAVPVPAEPEAPEAEPAVPEEAAPDPAEPVPPPPPPVAP